MNNITILICVHSKDVLHDKLLLESLYSLTKQTYKNFDVLLLLDECWEYTKPLIENHNLNLNLKIIKRLKKEGLSYAKNYGLKLINTEWIAFLDGDDLYEHTKLEKQVNFLNENKDIDFLGTQCWNRFLNQSTYKKSCFELGTNETHEQLERKLQYENVMTHGSLMIRKSCLNDLGGYNHIKGMEDWDLWKRAIKKYKFHQLQKRLYVLTIGTSVTR